MSMERRVRSKQAWNNLIFMKYRKVKSRVTIEHLILGAVPNEAWTASAAVPQLKHVGPLWWVRVPEAAIKEYDSTEPGTLCIYTDGSGIDGER